jgi:hypothetical protein
VYDLREDLANGVASMKRLVNAPNSPRFAANDDGLGAEVSVEHQWPAAVVDFV